MPNFETLPVTSLSEKVKEIPMNEVDLSKGDAGEENIPTEATELQLMQEQDDATANQILGKIQNGEIGNKTKETIGDELVQFHERYEAKKYNLEEMISLSYREELIVSEILSQIDFITIEEVTQNDIRQMIQKLEGSLAQLEPSMWDKLPLSQKNVLKKLKKKLEKVFELIEK